MNENELLVWNDGRQFKEKDVRSICSLGSSDKNLTHIGTFGIGFKAVYNYTDFPEIYSDDERFRIHNFIKPEGIDENREEIAPFLDELPIVKSVILEGEERNNIETFFKTLEL